MIERLTPDAFATALPQLALILADAVDDGASVGFLSGFGPQEAAAWWQNRAAGVATGSLVVWVARAGGGEITGTITLAYEEKPNARHRAEVVKLAVHRRHRGGGAGRRLLAAAEEHAAATGITLLMLDTETGSPAERLYLSAGWQRYGIVDDYAAAPDGDLRPCSFYLKKLG